MNNTFIEVLQLKKYLWANFTTHSINILSALIENAKTEGKSAMPTCLTSVDVGIAKRTWWKYNEAFSQHCGYQQLMKVTL